MRRPRSKAAPTDRLAVGQRAAHDRLLPPVRFSERRRRRRSENRTGGSKRSCAARCPTASLSVGAALDRGRRMLWRAGVLHVKRPLGGGTYFGGGVGDFRRRRDFI